MKDVPEIAPEIRGLLEEIVANPRSAIRLAPRQALSSWFDSGETIRATDVSRDQATRHLIAAHREELAALLQEASWISYWKAPVLAHRPVGEDGKLYHPTQREPAWLQRAEREVNRSPDRSLHVELLRQCLDGIKPQQGWALAQASLGLVPSDRTRYLLALSIPWSRPRTAISLLSRIAWRAQPARTRLDAVLSLAARTCHLGLYSEARDLYRRHTAMAPQSHYGWICSFNLSCFLGEATNARADALELDKVTRPNDPALIEELELLREWVSARNEEEINEARRTSRHISGQIPEVAGMLSRVFES